MPKSYREIAKPTKLVLGSELEKFSSTVRKQVKDEYELTFGLGNLVSMRREELEISQSVLASETGIPQADISRIECGKANPTIKTLEKILDALQLKIIVSKR